MAITGVGRYSELLRRILDVPGGSAAIGREISPDLVPVLVLESDRPEWQFLQGERRCMGETGVAPPSGALGFVQLYNPAASGMLVVLEQVMARTYDPASLPTTAPRLRMTFAPIAAPLSGNRSVIDTRWGNVLPKAEIRAGTNPTGTVLGYLTVRASVREAADTNSNTWAILENPGIVLGPNSGVSVDAGALDTNLNATFIWRERALPQVER